MQQNKECCQHGCQLCQKEAQIDQLHHRRKRDLSLQSIYQKDYKGSLYDMANRIRLPKGSKNQSSNLQFNGKKYLDLSSTYGVAYESKKGDKLTHAHSGQSIINPEGIRENFKSTYNNSYHKHPMIQDRNSYKIADFEFYNIKTTLPKDTEYNQQYKKISNSTLPINLNHKKSQERHEPIRLFETTQRSHFQEKHSARSKAILPVQNMSTLPTSSFVYNSTYKNEFKDQTSHSPLATNTYSKHFSSKKCYF